MAVKMGVKKNGGSGVSLKGNRCYRCGHEWLPVKKNKPSTVCPKCKNPYWNKPKQKKNHD